MQELQEALSIYKRICFHQNLQSQEFLLQKILTVYLAQPHPLKLQNLEQSIDADLLLGPWLQEAQELTRNHGRVLGNYFQSLLDAHPLKTDLKLNEKELSDLEKIDWLATNRLPQMPQGKLAFDILPFGDKTWIKSIRAGSVHEDLREESAIFIPNDSILQKGKKKFPLKDLHLHYLKGRLFLVHKSGESLRPAIVDRSLLKNHPLSIILNLIGQQGIPKTLSWNWGTLAQKDWLPQISYGKLILSPRRLRLTLPQFSHLSFAQIRQELGGEGHILGTDQTLLNLHEKMFESFKEKGQHELVIYHLPTSSPKTFKTHYQQYPEKARELTKQLPRPKPGEFLPLTDTLGVHIKIKPDDMNDFILNVMKPTIQEGLKKKWIHSWFFSREFSEGSELRIRVKGKDPFKALVHGLEKRSLKSGLSLAGKLELKSYFRFYDLLGGIEGAKSYEHISQIDSEYFLSIFSELKSRVKNITSEDLFSFEIIYFLLSTHHYFEGAGLSLKERIAFCQKKETSPLLWSIEQGVFADIGSFIKENNPLLRLALCNKQTSDQFIDNLQKNFSLRTKKVQKHQKLILASIKKGKTTVSIEEFCYRLIHMSKLRLTGRIPMLCELFLYSQLGELYETILET